jgi:type IX secretion system PorP/SprF family membrane protein
MNRMKKSIFKYSVLIHFKLILSIIFTFGIKSQGFSQDPQFSQFYAASMYLNPAFAGNTMQHRLSGIYRNQWPGISKAYVSYSFAYDHNLADLSSGLGMMFTRDVAGTGGLSFTNIGGLYSYYFKLNEKIVVRFGTKLSYTLRNYDRSRLRFNDQIITGSPATIETLNSGISYFDINAGGLLYSDKYWVGVAFDHINTPEESLLNENTPLPIKSSIHGGYRFVLDEGSIKSEGGTHLTIATTYKAQEKWDQLDLGGYFNKDAFVIGFWYRGIPIFKNYKPGYANNDAIIILLGFQAKKIRFGYSYDITISKLNNSSAGAHEVSIIYESFKKKRKRKISFAPCAKF